MKGSLFWISALAIGNFVCLVSAQQNETVVERDGKGINNLKFASIIILSSCCCFNKICFSVFSLFSVVQFKNTGCRSQSSLTSGQR